MFECRCPICASSAKLPDKYVGKSLRCKKCGERFVATRPLYIAPFEPEIVDAAPRREKTDAERNAEALDKILNSAADMGTQYINHLQMVLLVKLAIVFACLFFCCGLPVILSSFQPPK